MDETSTYPQRCLVTGYPPTDTVLVTVAVNKAVDTAVSLGEVLMLGAVAM